MVETFAKENRFRAFLVRAVLLLPPIRRRLIRFADKQLRSGNITQFLLMLLGHMQTERQAMSQTTKRAHIKGLMSLLQTAAAPDSFQPARFQILHDARGQIILGDTCVFARRRDGRISSMVSEPDVMEIYVPISRRCVLVACNGIPSLSVEEINESSAVLSVAKFFGGSEAHAGLQPKIGAMSGYLSVDEVFAMVRDGWTGLARS